MIDRALLFWRLIASGAATALAAASAVAQAPSRAPVPGAPAGVTAFVDVNVVPMDTERILANQTVLVRHGWIIALGPTNKVGIPAGAVRINGRGQYLLPGFGDMHVHLSMGATMDSAALERQLFGLLAQGATTIRNMDHLPGPSVLPFRARAAAGTLWSPRIYTSKNWYPWPGRASDGSNASAVGRYVATLQPESVATYVAAYKAAGYDFIKPYFESPIVFDSLLAVGRRLGLPVAGHVSFVARTDTKAWVIRERASLEQVLAGRMRSLEHMMGYSDYLYRQLVPEASVRDLDVAVLEQRRDTVRQRLATLQPAIAALAGAIKRAGLWNCPTLIQKDLGDPQINRQLIKALQDAGAGLLLGTDGGQVHEELEAFVAFGLTPYQALLTGTRHVAEYFGTLDSTGTVAVGKRADLVLLAENPLADVGHAAQPAGVMIGGRWLARETIDRRLADMRARTASP